MLITRPQLLDSLFQRTFEYLETIADLFAGRI
jgi:hypothetical protein